MNLTFTNHPQHGPRNNMGDITAQAQRDVRFAAISGRQARSRVGSCGIGQDIQLALFQPSPKLVGRLATASPVPLTG